MRPPGGCACGVAQGADGGAIHATGGATLMVQILGCSGRNNSDTSDNALNLLGTTFTEAALYVADGHTDWAFVRAVYPTSQPCPLQPLPPSALRGSCPEDGLLPEGQACNLTCDTADGSGLIGDPTARCNSGVLVWKALCTGADPCRLPSALPPHTQPISSDGGCRAGTQLFTGGTCAVQCETGYAQNTSGGASYEYSCLAGHLSAPDPDCQPCPVNYANALPGAGSCTKCDASHRCSTNGERGQSQCDCIAECLPTTPNPHQHWVNSSTGDQCLPAPKSTGLELLANSRCVAACDEGYVHSKPVGGVAVNVYRCTDGQWVGGNWQCEAPASDDSPLLCTEVWVSCTVLIGLGMAVLLVAYGCHRRQAAADQAAHKPRLLQQTLPTLVYAAVCAVLLVAMPCATAEEQWQVRAAPCNPCSIISLSIVTHTNGLIIERGCSSG
eukprot:COSAG01_NODE_5136_length_4460_cov_2.629901_6_plen_442_part_00